jgi:hypothetical protein
LQISSGVNEKALIGFTPAQDRGSQQPGFDKQQPGRFEMGLVELLLVVLVIAAIAGGIGVSPLLWLLLLVVLVIMLTSGGFGYRRGGRI